MGHIRNISESRLVLELVVKSFKQLFQSSRSVALWGDNGDTAQSSGIVAFVAQKTSSTPQAGDKRIVVGQRHHMGLIGPAASRLVVFDRVRTVDIIGGWTSKNISNGTLPCASAFTCECCETIPGHGEIRQNLRIW